MTSNIHTPAGCISLDGLKLFAGAHQPDQKEMCAMEAVSAYCGCTVRTDKPDCASQTIGAFVRHLNDRSAYARERLVSRIPALAVSKDKDRDHAVRRAKLLAARAKEQAAHVAHLKVAYAADAAAYAAVAYAADAAAHAAAYAALAASYAANAAADAAADAAAAAANKEWDFALETLDLALACE